MNSSPVNYRTGFKKYGLNLFRNAKKSSLPNGNIDSVKAAEVFFSLFHVGRSWLIINPLQSGHKDS